MIIYSIGSKVQFKYYGKTYIGIINNMYAKSIVSCDIYYIIISDGSIYTISEKKVKLLSDIRKRKIRNLLNESSISN